MIRYTYTCTYALREYTSRPQLLLPLKLAEEGCDCFLMLGSCRDSVDAASAGLGASAGPSAAFFLAAFFFFAFLAFSGPGAVSY